MATQQLSDHASPSDSAERRLLDVDALVEALAPFLLSPNLKTRDSAYRKLWEELNAGISQDHAKFYSRFLGLHIPEFIKVWTSHMGVCHDLTSHLDAFACAVTRTALFKRWVRENGQEAVNLLGALYVWFDKAHPTKRPYRSQIRGSAYRSMDEDVDIFRSNTSVLEACEQIKVILVHLPDNFDRLGLRGLFPSGSAHIIAAASALRVNLGPLFVGLRQDAICIPDLPCDGTIDQQLCKLIICPEHNGLELMFLLGDENSTIASAKKLADQRGTRVNWEMCEARRAYDSACKEVKGEMMACGGCRTVRYCSKAHQREHWKDRHKHECFAPVWST